MLLSNSNVWNKDWGYVVEIIFTRFEYGQYSPMNTLLYRMLYNIFGMKSVYFHDIGLLIHILNTLLVFRLVSQVNKSFDIQRSKESILIGTVFFSILHVHAETISWIAATKILGCSLFSLMAFTLFVKNINAQLTIQKILTVIALVFAFGFKEQAIIVPPIMIVFAAFYNNSGLRKAILSYGYLLVLSLLGLYWSYMGFLELAFVFNNSNGLSGTFLVVARPIYCLLFYIANTFAPLYLSVRYTEPTKYEYVIFMSLGILLCIGFVKWAWFRIRNNKDILFGLVFFCISMSCFINIIPLPRPSIVADRYLYFSSIGLVIIIIPIIEVLLLNRIGRGLLMCYLLILTFISFERCLTWSFL